MGAKIGRIKVQVQTQVQVQLTVLFELGLTLLYGSHIIEKITSMLCQRPFGPSAVAKMHAFSLQMGFPNGRLFKRLSHATMSPELALDL
jgi:hypothetical protein